MTLDAQEKTLLHKRRTKPYVPQFDTESNLTSITDANGHIVRSSSARSGCSIETLNSRYTYPKSLERWNSKSERISVRR